MADERKPRVPTEEEIGKLPRWAQVAFAARCARRVQTWFTASWPEAPQAHIEDLENAIIYAETASTDPNINIQHLLSNTVFLTRHFDSAYESAHAAADAADAAIDLEYTAFAVFRASRATCFASNDTAMITAVYNDYKFLFFLANQEKWTDDTPVPPEVFGPMWPEGKPEGWLDDKQTCQMEPSKKLLLQIAVPRDVDDEEVDETVIKLAEEASRLHMAQGGTGLVIKAVHVFDEAMVPLEVRP